MFDIEIDYSQQLVFVGDNHGEWNFILNKIEEKNIENICLFSVGDIGIGFKYKKDYEYSQAKKLSNLFAKRNINFYGIRGNHDDPFFFTGKNKIKEPNFELIEDYTILKYNDKYIQAIGGAISIDRTSRVNGKSYWSNEAVKYNPDLVKNVDILVTHTAPSHCFPQQFNELVYNWMLEDAYLIGDLSNERAIMDEIFKKSKPRHHYYGHFHANWTERVNGCVHNLLNINELKTFNM